MIFQKSLNEHCNGTGILIQTSSRVIMYLKNKFQAISSLHWQPHFQICSFLDRKLSFDEHIQCTNKHAN